MKKFLSIFLTVIVVVGAGLAMTVSASAAPARGYGHHGGRHGGGGYYRENISEERRWQYHEDHRAEYEAYLEELLKDGTITQKEHDEYKESPWLMPGHCWEFDSSSTVGTTTGATTGTTRTYHRGGGCRGTGWRR